MSGFVIATCSLIGYASCNQPSVLTEREKPAIIDSIRLMLDNYNNDVRKHGLTAEFSYLDSSAEFFWVPPGFTDAISYDSVATILKQNASGYKSIDNSFDTLRIIPLNSGHATYTARIHSTIIDTSDREITIKLLESGVLIKRPGGWKLLCGQTSLVK